MIKICVFGPESTGKTTLVRNLSRHLDAAYVLEYAQDYIAQKQGDINFNDLDIMLKEQLKREDEAAAQSPKILFCDSDALTTKIWSHFLFDQCSDYVQEQARLAAQRYHHTLLMDVDVPWVDDVHRYAPEERTAFFTNCENALIDYNRSYTIISGEWEERFEKALRVVSGYLDAD